MKRKLQEITCLVSPVMKMQLSFPIYPLLTTTTKYLTVTWHSFKMEHWGKENSIWIIEKARWSGICCSPSNRTQTGCGRHLQYFNYVSNRTWVFSSWILYQVTYADETTVLWMFHDKSFHWPKQFPVLPEKHIQDSSGLAVQIQSFPCRHLSERVSLLGERA